MERFQRFRCGINLPAFDPGNYCFVILISNPSKQQNTFQGKIKTNQNQKATQKPNNVKGIRPMCNKFCEFIEKQIIAVKLDCFS